MSKRNPIQPVEGRPNVWVDLDHPERELFFARPGMTAKEVKAEWAAAYGDEPAPEAVDDLTAN